MRARSFNGGAETRVRFAGILSACAATALLLVGPSSALAFGTGTASLQTKPSPSVSVGGSVSDSVQMIGLPGTMGGVGSAPGGNVTFSLYGPDDTTCSKPAVFSPAPVMLTAQAMLVDLATSPSYTPTAPGAYSWIVAYSGDGAYAPITSKCGDETVQVTDVTPKLTTVASPGVQAGSGALTDTATLTGGKAPTGSIRFLLFPPTDPTCAGKVVDALSTIPVANPTDPTSVTSDPYTPTTAGTYHWIAVYSGDAHNGAVAGACSDAGESVVVTAGPANAGTPGGPGTGSGPGGAAGPCDAAATAKAVLAGITSTLTGKPGVTFKNTCSAGVRIVLRGKDIRPAKKGKKASTGFVTMANDLTHISPTGPALSFSLNAAGQSLRSYALSHHRSIIAFLIVHVLPDKTSKVTETLQILTLG